MKPALLRLLAAGAALSLAACGTSTQEPPAAKLAVVATTPEVADFVRVIGGGDVAVTQIIKPNVDPHDYEPTPADLQAIGAAKVVVENGVGLEEWLDRTVESAGFSGPVIDSSQGVTLRKDDPHIWHDPRNAKIMAGTIERGLAAADPGRAATFADNLSAYATKLDQLDAANVAAWAKVAPEQRKLVTDHDAFGYYVDRYQVQFVGSVIPGLDTSAELSARQLTDLVAKIKATGTRAVFTESSLPPKSAAALAQRAGVEVVGGDDALYGDSLGAQGTPQGTYLGAEQHNTATIVAALGG